MTSLYAYHFGPWNLHFPEKYKAILNEKIYIDFLERECTLRERIFCIDGNFLLSNSGNNCVTTLNVNSVSNFLSSFVKSDMLLLSGNDGSK